MPALGAATFGKLVDDADGWRRHTCGGSRRWRQFPDGRVEIDGLGFVTRPLAKGVYQWRGLIAKASAKYGVHAAWVAGLMSLESGGNPAVGRSNPYVGGIMQIMPQLMVDQIAGRHVTLQDLQDDHALSIDVGTGILRRHLDQYGGDFVSAAIAYNAGGVKCGVSHAHVVVDGKIVDRNGPCPPNPWGVVIDCYVNAAGQFTQSDYPGAVVAFANTAVAEHFGESAAASGSATAVTPATRVVATFIGLALGYAGWRYASR